MPLQDHNLTYTVTYPKGLWKLNQFWRHNLLNQFEQFEYKLFGHLGGPVVYEAHSVTTMSSVLLSSPHVFCHCLLSDMK